LVASARQIKQNPEATMLRTRSPALLPCAPAGPPSAPPAPTTPRFPAARGDRDANATKRENDGPPAYSTTSCALGVDGPGRPFRAPAGLLRLSDEMGTPQAVEDLAVDLAESTRALRPPPSPSLNLGRSAAT
jgi:hypothetical protein